MEKLTVKEHEIYSAAGVISDAARGVDIAAGEATAALRAAHGATTQPALAAAIHDISDAVTKAYVNDDKLANVLAAYAIWAGEAFRSVDVDLAASAPAGAPTGANGPSGPTGPVVVPPAGPAGPDGVTYKQSVAPAGSDRPIIG